MASKSEKTAGELTLVESLAEKHKTPAAVLAGVKTQMGWVTGKAVTEADYTAAVSSFLGRKAGS